jgi:broad specificity phosphatase PhoE
MLLIRHAQSEWNLHFGRTRIDPGLPDPPLTVEGVRQAEAVAEELRSADIVRLVCSPYRRALQTASIIRERLGLDLTVEPLVRERCAFSCDQGSPPGALARDWPHLDFSALDEIWWGGMIESHSSLGERCARFRTRAASWDDQDRVAVVSHWGFIRALTGQPLGNIGTVRFRPDDPIHLTEELR